MKNNFLTLVVVIGFNAAVFSQELESSHDSRADKLLQTYCVTCHNETLKTAGLLLDQVDLGRIDQHAATLEKVVRKLHVRAMPPQGVPRPDPTDYEYLIEHLESELDKAAAANPNPGRTPPHRLNRAEYANAIRDILHLEINVEELLPPDPASSHGFDNIADVLGFSPMLMERYLFAAKAISRLAVGYSDGGTVVKTYQLPANFEQQDRVSEELPFGSRGGAVIHHYFPVDGDYLIRILVRRITDGLDAGKMIGFDVPKQMEVRLDGVKIKEYSVGGQQKADALELRVQVKAGMQSIGVSFLRDRLKAEGLDQEEQAGGVSLIEVEGPFNVTGIGESASRRKIFSCRPGQSSEEINCAEEILSNLARIAYRQPVQDVDIEPLIELYQSGRKKEGFDKAIGLAIQGILISPKFLFRVEREPENVKPGSVYAVNDLELASRLSFFLWSSVPDEQLLELATRGKLKEPETLERQVRRMLQDTRSEALVQNFATQWLHVRNLDIKSPPNADVFPEYNHNLKIAFQKEIELFFNSIIREDRSILDFLEGDYSYLNEQLARHYGISDVFGSHFRRVSLQDERRRWGLLGKGATLTVTSYSTRTSTTLRGKWILDNILGTPPPPPPPDVPSLTENAETLKLSMRERMEMHRTNPVCATCHQVMDPLGFALENFNGIGSWRDRNMDQTPIDASGKFPNGVEFDGPVEMREALWTLREQFIRTFVERMLTYALGRGVEYYDMPTVRNIVGESAQERYSFSSIIIGIIKSQPFQNRRLTRS